MTHNRQNRRAPSLSHQLSFLIALARAAVLARVRVVVSGFTYIEMDGVDGYKPGDTDTSDKPVVGAIIRAPAAHNFISRSGGDGHYAAYAETYSHLFLDNCVRFPITAIHPLTMARVIYDGYTCDPLQAGSYVAHIHNLSHFDLKLGDKDTQCPSDQNPPALNMNLAVSADQTNGVAGARITAGTVAVGANLDVSIDIISQQTPDAVLTVDYSAPSLLSPAQYQGQLTKTGWALYAQVQGCPASPILRRMYAATFGYPIANGKYFRPSMPGVYTFTLTAAKNQKTYTRTVSIRAVDPGEVPGPVDGPPVVDKITPTDGSDGVMVSMPVTAWFSEPVDGVDAATFTLNSVDGPVDATVYTGLENGHMYAVLGVK